MVIAYLGGQSLIPVTMPLWYVKYADVKSYRSVVSSA